jgi:formylmethanofuran dehydrogenase subunit E
MRALGGIILALTLAGCASVQPPACPAGQERLKTAQLFFGQNIGGKPGVSDADFRKFVDSELTSRFPDGLTIVDGGGQWKGSENQLIREASKVVVIVLPAKGDGGARIEAARAAYKHRFQQESVLLVTQASCVSF